MKQSLWVMYGACSLYMSTVCFEKKTPAVANAVKTNSNPGGSTMRIKIGDRFFKGTLFNSTTSAAFKSLLPLTVDMAELNGNEKYADLPGSISNSPNPVGTIQTGDLMLFGSRTLVLFYKTFPTSYSYTRIGRIDDVSELAAALGAGNVKVVFEPEQQTQ